MRGISALIFVCLSLTLIYNFQIIPALIPFVKAQTTTAVTLEMQKIIGSCVAEGQYGDFITVNYGSDGDVVSLETNAGGIALLTANITESAIKKLRGSDRLTVSIPIGNITGGAIFTGKGPKIDIDIVISQKITCEIENEFYERGINQTLHRIIAEVKVEVYALVPMSPQKIDVDIEYCIAETVIVGKVPDAYTKINRLSEDIEESDIDDIFDFGASID
ncbi:MAG: sporulation protein YunB [Clostridia bacterium]|nr:sporulation protein YunB [Clostridia bacterium]